MVRLAAIVCLVMSICFYAWGLSHLPWTWQMWMLCGLMLWCVSDAHPKVP